MGRFQCSRGYVFGEISPEASGLFGCCTEFQARYGGFDVGNEYVEEGRICIHPIIAYSFDTLLTHIGHRFAQYPRSVITSSNSTTYHHPIAVHVSPS